MYPCQPKCPRHHYDLMLISQVEMITQVEDETLGCWTNPIVGYLT